MWCSRAIQSHVINIFSSRQEPVFVGMFIQDLLGQWLHTKQRVAPSRSCQEEWKELDSGIAGSIQKTHLNEIHSFAVTRPIPIPIPIIIIIIIIIIMRHQASSIILVVRLNRQHCDKSPFLRWQSQLNTLRVLGTILCPQLYTILDGCPRILILRGKVCTKWLVLCFAPGSFGFPTKISKCAITARWKVAILGEKMNWILWVLYMQLKNFYELWGISRYLHEIWAELSSR